MRWCCSSNSSPARSRKRFFSGALATSFARRLKLLPGFPADTVRGRAQCVLIPLLTLPPALVTLIPARNSLALCAWFAIPILPSNPPGKIPGCCSNPCCGKLQWVREKTAWLGIFKARWLPRLPDALGRIFPRSNEGKLLCRRELGEFGSQDVVMLCEYLS